MDGSRGDVHYSMEAIDVARQVGPVYDDMVDKLEVAGERKWEF
jgi:hypothetical protein